MTAWNQGMASLAGASSRGQRTPAARHDRGEPGDGFLHSVQDRSSSQWHCYGGRIRFSGAGMNRVCLSLAVGILIAAPTGAQGPTLVPAALRSLSPAGVERGRTVTFTLDGVKISGAS